jgi:hypothetical protein
LRVGRLANAKKFVTLPPLRGRGGERGCEGKGLDKAKNFVPSRSLKRGEAGGGVDDSGVRLVVRFGMIFEKWQGGGGAGRYL